MKEIHSHQCMVDEPAANFGSLTDKEFHESKIKRELVRIRKSPSFRIGKHIVNSFEKPWLIPFLPLSLPLLVFNICLERLGKKPHPDSNQLLITGKVSRNCILMFPTNGVGFGHFTRLLAVSKRIKKLDPSIEIIFFTTMPTLHLLKREGIPAYHLPGKKYFSEMSSTIWNSIVEEMISSVIAIHQPSMFIFDGAFPYRGMLNVIEDRSNLTKVWLRRGTFKKGKSIPVDSMNYFDYIVWPKDKLVDEFEYDLENFEPSVVKCDPILLVDEEEMRPRTDLRDRLGIPHDALLVYLQLGAGQIDDIKSNVNLCLNELKNHDNIYVVLGESMIGDRIPSIGGNVRVLTDYPNSLDFKAFDFTIMAAGYNSYHEAIRFSLPMICIPNQKTGMDDQLARAEVAEKAGAMIVLRKVTPSKLKIAVERLMNADVRASMAKKSESLHRPNGANQLALWIINEI